MKSDLLHSLNQYLGVELGRRADGHSIFAWKNSDELFWPAFVTGRKLARKVEFTVPIIGGGTQTVEREQLVPEYRRDRQMRALNVWVVTKWLDPEALIWGWIGRHGGESRPAEHPTHERLVEIWNERFPGADFPYNGWRIPTDATLPRSPDSDREPNWADTRYFAACVKEQTRLGFDERLKHMLDSEDAKSAAETKRIEDEIRDSFPALLNPVPGKRSNFVSFPWSKKDRM